MATSKKSTSTAKTEETAADEPQPAEEPKAAAEPRTAGDGEEARTSEGTAPSSEPTPWRVETYSDGVQWGWRLCAANGNIIRESGAFFDTKDGALDDARDSADTASATFLDDNRTGTTRRGW